MNTTDFILWSDESLVAVNKPAGLLTVADGYQKTLPHLAGLLQSTFGQVWTIHRLDKDTSGIILFALTAETHRALSQQFQKRETRKEYHTIVIGSPAFDTKTISLPLKVNGDRSHRTVVNHSSGKPAETDITVLKRSGGFTLCSVFPHTGYTHQIRAHLSTIGLPILADPLYKSLYAATDLQIMAANRAPDLPIQRLALHAHRLSFNHPLSGDQMLLEAPYPDDFKETIGIIFK